MRVKNRRFVALAIAVVAMTSAPLAADGQVPSSDAAQSRNDRACLAIVLPSVQGVTGNASDVATALRDLFTSYLSGPSIQVVALDARLASQALEEARQKPCEPVLFATLERKRGGGGFGRMLGQAVGTSTPYLPGGGSLASAAARAAATAGLQTVASLAASTKEKDELRLEYTLQAGNGKTQLGPKTEQAKAKVDGEDLLTPLVEKVASAIVAGIGKK